VSAPGPSSRNSQYLVAFCDSEKLSQTFQNRGKVEGRDSWATWCHPGSGKLHLKDFILIPKGEVPRVQCWPAPEIEVGTDHNLVICQLYCREGAVVAALQRAAKRGVDQGSGSVQKVPRVSDRVKLRKLDTAPAPERVREYVAQLGNGLRGKPGNWEVTEKVMIEAAIKTLPTAQKPEEMTWRTAEAQRELRQLYKQQSSLRRMVRPNTKVDDQARHGVYLERKKVQRSIRKCIKRHKDKFRLQLSNMVVRGEDKVAAQAAISVLGKGYDLGLVRGKEAKAPVVPQVFALHFDSTLQGMKGGF
jgi:hypothetical protein